MRRRTIGAVALAASLVLFAAACSDDNDRPATGDDGGPTTTTVDPDATTTTGGGPFGQSTTTTADGEGGGGGGQTATTAAGGAPSGGGASSGGSGSAAPTSPVGADTPRDLADALGGECTGYADTGAALQQPGTTAEGTCLFGGEVINLYTFADVAAQRAFVDEGAFFDCSFIVAFGGGGASWYVAGEGWIARPGPEGVARQLATALDGEAASYVCEA